MKTLSADKVFTPIQVGPMELTHRALAATAIIRSMSSNAMAHCPIHFVSNFAIVLEHFEECARESR